MAWKWTGMDGEEGSAGPRQMVAVRLRCGASRGREGGRKGREGSFLPMTPAVGGGSAARAKNSKVAPEARRGRAF